MGENKALDLSPNTAIKANNWANFHLMYIEYIHYQSNIQYSVSVGMATIYKCTRFTLVTVVTGQKHTFSSNLICEAMIRILFLPCFIRNMVNLFMNVHKPLLCTKGVQPQGGPGACFPRRFLKILLK